MAACRPPPGHFNLLYFATAAAFTKRDSETFEGPMSLSDLFDTLDTRYPGIKRSVLDSCAVTVNLEYADVVPDEGGQVYMVKEGDEVAIIPPVSSG
jgi:small subunit ribosomal protein S28e